MGITMVHDGMWLFYVIFRCPFTGLGDWPLKILKKNSWTRKIF
jgi:hypothetical protein